MKKILSSVLTLGAVSMLLAGCAHHEGAYLPVNTTKFNQEDTAKFVLLDERAQYSVTCSGLQQRAMPDGTMEVTANVRNRENRSIEVQINCVFKDEQAFPVDETPFQTLVLTENATQGVTFKSSNAKAKTYTIRVRQVR
jgi:hypothetical protein